MKSGNRAKELYQRLRVLSCEELWTREVAEFDRASPRERLARVAVVRAVGVVFSEGGSDERKAAAREWLRGLLQDPEEKVRRYAMAALPKLGAAAPEEAELLELWRRSTVDRERKFLGRALEKIGGEATLGIAEEGRLAQKVAANVARRGYPSSLRLGAAVAGAVEIRLRCREGLERILEDELHEQGLAGERFRLVRTAPGMVTVSPVGSFGLRDLYELRCFGTMSFYLGACEAGMGDEPGRAAALIVSATTRRLLETFTDGPIRYRIEMVSKGHQRASVKQIADRVYARCPEILNDSREAVWQIDIRHHGRRISAELTPRLRPDPRFAYRLKDVPAASHPPLAAAMARLAGNVTDGVIWDPFCGSGLELVECARRGGVRTVVGTDVSADAVAIAAGNFAAAIEGPTRAVFGVSDFRDYRQVEALMRGDVSLVITNPPLGRRVPIPNLHELIADLFSAGADVLRPGGRLVFVNPLPVQPPAGLLGLEFRQRVDLGGFYCHLERYVRRA